MRLCRFRREGTVQLGFYDDQFIAPISTAALAYRNATHNKLDLPSGDELLELLPPDGRHFAQAKKLADWLAQNGNSLPAAARLLHNDVELLVPIPRPKKLLLLAGNYNEHLQEGGGAATEREETFPYVFMKPPSTTLNDPGKPVVLPSVSPNHVDWELELCVIIGRNARHVSEAEALQYVAGYAVVVDISDRKYSPNLSRKVRPNDKWFDWEHGKWHDTFCPCGPCVTSADAVPDPQNLKMKLTVNGITRQEATTSQQIFPVAAVIAFISDIMTLEPGDLISTGTPAGVGSTTGTYLRAGDRIDAWIDGIGTLFSPVVAEVQ